MMLYEIRLVLLAFLRRRPYAQHPGEENPFAKLSLEAQCRNCTLEMINTMTISWSLWVVVGGVTNKSAQNVPDLRSMTRAGIDSEFLILRANSLESGKSYAVRVKG